jgi:hypothetical protein
MADGDIIHPTLSARYYGVYKRICEEIEDEESLARQALRCLKKDLSDYGDSPLQLIQREVPLFEQLSVELQFGIPIDWAQTRRNIKELAREFSGSDDGLQLVVRACEQQLDLLQKQRPYAIPSGHFAFEITQQYLLNIYDARFANRVPQTRHHYQNAHPVLVHERIINMRRFINPGIAAFAQQIVEQKALRLPPRTTKLWKIDLDKDLDRSLSELL